MVAKIAMHNSVGNKAMAAAAVPPAHRRGDWMLPEKRILPLLRKKEFYQQECNDALYLPWVVCFLSFLTEKNLHIRSLTEGQPKELSREYFVVCCAHNQKQS